MAKIKQHLSEFLNKIYSLEPFPNISSFYTRSNLRRDLVDHIYYRCREFSFSKSILHCCSLLGIKDKKEFIRIVRSSCREYYIEVNKKSEVFSSVKEVISFGKDQTAPITITIKRGYFIQAVVSFDSSKRLILGTRKYSQPKRSLGERYFNIFIKSKKL